MGTIQVDYNLPERFDLTYKGADNKNHRPVMIVNLHFMGLERFVAILLEHTCGNFPIWLHTKQTIILTISENYEKYAQKVLNLLENNEIRALIDDRNEIMGKKIRDAEVKKIPFMIIVGEQEEKTNTISVRRHGGKFEGITIEAFKKLIDADISNALEQF